MTLRDFVRRTVLVPAVCCILPMLYFMAWTLAGKQSADDYIIEIFREIWEGTEDG